MNEQENGLATGGDPKEVGNQMMRTVAWFAVAAVVALVIALCALVLYAMGIF
jgi:Na+/H+-dicarboxylate symporter